MPIEPKEPDCLITSPFSADMLLEASDEDGIKAAKDRLVQFEYSTIKETSISDILTKTEEFFEKAKNNFFSAEKGP